MSELINILREIRAEIRGVKDQWIPLIEEMRLSKNYPLYQKLEKDMRGASVELLRDSGVYLLKKGKKPLYILKPMDEDHRLINNPRRWIHFGNPEVHEVYGFSLTPYYQTIQREFMTYELARLMGIEEIVPPTVLDMVKSEDFFDLTDCWDIKEQRKAIEEGVGPDREKLCTIMTYFGKATPLGTMIRTLSVKGKSREQVIALLNPKDQEKILILQWLSLELDPHLNNILALPTKGGYRLKKIDHSYTFPEVNVARAVHLMNYIPQQRKISKEMRACITKTSLSKVLITMNRLQFSTDAQIAFKKRFHLLKKIVKNNNNIHFVYNEYINKIIGL